MVLAAFQEGTAIAVEEKGGVAARTSATDAARVKKEFLGRA
jgi:hypothetical protein